MSNSYQKEYRDNITDEQEQKRREAISQYQKNIEIIWLRNKNKNEKKLIDDIKKNIKII